MACGNILVAIRFSNKKLTSALSKANMTKLLRHFEFNTGKVFDSPPYCQLQRIQTIYIIDHIPFSNWMVRRTFSCKHLLR